MMDATTLRREVAAHIAECGTPTTAQARAAAVTAICGRLALRDPQQWRAVREAVGLASLANDLQRTPRRKTP